MASGSFLLAGQFGPDVLASLPIEDVTFPDEQSRVQFERLVRRQTHVYAITCAAGDVAQVRAKQRLEDPPDVYDCGGCGPARLVGDAQLRSTCSDEEHLATLVKKVSDKGNAEGFMAWVYDKAARLVQSNWDAIEGLAAVLEERRELDRDDLYAILPRALWNSEVPQAA
jgi:hypothetical protein